MHPNTPGLQHAPPPQAYPPRPSFTPFLLSTFLLFPRRHFPCSWQTDINRAASKNFNEKQTLWHSPSTQAPQLMPHPPNRTLQHAPHPHRHIHPALLSPPSSFPLSSFFSRRHFPCSWQTNINTAISEGLSESQAHWQAKKFRDHWQEKSGKEALK